jgi:Holliday junction resolvasome RuvABC endonuclease subunit
MRDLMMATILMVDLGTLSGFCVGTADNHISGVWNLKGGRYEGGGMRFVHFRKYLNDIAAAFAIDQVYFEEVRRHKGVDAAHVYGGLMAVLTSWCEERGIPYSGLTVGNIKKNWTGLGNASKEAMIEVAEDRGYQPKDDNEADAIAGFHLGLSKL